MFRKIVLAAASVAALSAGGASAEVVGKVGVDWIGNDIIVDAIPDPAVKGVTCHVTYFDRSLIDRVKNGNWFEIPPTIPSPAARPGRSRSATSTCRRMATRCSRRACR